MLPPMLHHVAFLGEPLAAMGACVLFQTLVHLQMDHKILGLGKLLITSCMVALVHNSQVSFMVPNKINVILAWMEL